MEKYKTTIFVVLGLAIIASIAVLWFGRVSHKQTPEALSSVTVNSLGGSTTGIQGGSVHMLPQDSATVAPTVPMPNLDRAIPATTPDLDAAAYTQLLKDISVAVDDLRKNPASYQDWINLGLDRQMLSDYAGAEEVWIYATKLAPQGEVAFANLGNLYEIYLKEYSQSETYYQKAIAINPADTNLYRSLFELYSAHYKQGTSAAEDILKEGIAKNPTALDLQVLLARLYRDTSRTTEAKAEYDVAIKTATAIGNTLAVSQLQTEKIAF